MSSSITEQELTRSKRVSIWGNALVAIATAYDEQGIEAATKLAKDTLDAAYGYNLGPVLFKPTLASGETNISHNPLEGALSYFVGSQ